MFMAGQGYPITTNTLLQDNESAIKMERNGRSSCTSNSKHIHTRYFFVKDRVDKKELRIEYCPTEEMLADFYTKPLQGRLFRVMREIIMGMRPISDLKLLNNVQIKERVENMT